MATLKSFELNGKKLSFANWISNISPMDCLFTSMIDSEKVEQTMFQWQVDALKNAGQNAFKEGSKSVGDRSRSTTVFSNVTQILRKVVCVTDTANASDAYGRTKELSYQMEKASRELNRDIEWAFLNNGSSGGNENLHTTGGIRGLIAPFNLECPDTGAVVSKVVTSLDEPTLFDLTYNLYMAGSDANIIMFHPKHSMFFSELHEKGVSRTLLFENTDKVDFHVGSLEDPMGVTYQLVPNRHMPENFIYFFNPDDFTKMILREPKREKLTKTGSSEKWMIETELGLRLKHPFAAGMLRIGKNVTHPVFVNAGDADTNSPTLITKEPGGGELKIILGKGNKPTKYVIRENASISLTYYLKDINLTADPNKKTGIRVEVVKNGVVIAKRHHKNENITNATKFTIRAIDTAGIEDAGIYEVRGYKYSLENDTFSEVEFTDGVAISVGKYPAI